MKEGTKNFVRTWHAVDECGNATGLSQVVPCSGLSLQLKVLLQGAFIASADTPLMRDDLRKKGLLPTKEPYTELAIFTHVGKGGGETCVPQMFDKTGTSTIVD